MCKFLQPFHHFPIKNLHARITHHHTEPCVCMPGCVSASLQCYQVLTGRWVPQLVRVKIVTPSHISAVLHACDSGRTCEVHRKEESGAKVIHAGGGHEGQGNEAVREGRSERITQGKTNTLTQMGETWDKLNTTSLKKNTTFFLFHFPKLMFYFCISHYTHLTACMYFISMYA